MTEAQLIKDYGSLPKAFQREVADFIGYLKYKAIKEPKKKIVLGYVKEEIAINDIFDKQVKTKKAIIAELEDAFEEVKQIRDGKKKGKTLKEFLDEI